MKHLGIQLAIATSVLALAACDRFQTPSPQPHGSVSAMALAYMQKDDPDGYSRAKGLADPLSDPEVEFYAGWPKLKHRLASDATDNGCATTARLDDGLGQYKATIAGMSAAEAEGYIVKSANAGYARAQAVVANLIDHGAVPAGLTGDDQSALAWMTKAANQNDDEAQYQLGEYYQSGRYADRDAAQAVQWYGKAADQGNVRAMVALADLYMDGNQVQRDTDRALDLYRKAADADSEKAEVALGAAYYDGKVVTRDYGQSAKYYEMATHHCNHAAQFRLGFLYQTGQGVGHDDAKAADLYGQSAKFQSSAAYNLGIMYEKGQGVPQDYAKAADAFAMGVKKGDTSSMEELAKLYDSGQGVEKDTARARDLYCRTNDRFNCLRLKMFGGSSKASASEAAD
jgi:hypothetical protein